MLQRCSSLVHAGGKNPFTFCEQLVYKDSTEVVLYLWAVHPIGNANHVEYALCILPISLVSYSRQSAPTHYLPEQTENTIRPLLDSSGGLSSPIMPCGMFAN